MTNEKITIAAQLATLIDLVQQNQSELKRLSAVQERILTAISPHKPPLKYVVLTPPMSFEYPDIELKIDAREWEAITAGRSLCIIGSGYSFEGEHEAQDYWFFTGGIKGGRLKVLMRVFFNQNDPDYMDPKSWEYAFEGHISEVTIDEYDENEAVKYGS